MQSIRRSQLIYTDISTSVLDHDDDYDSELIYIGNDKLYKGAIDPRYTEHGLDVQWLYNDNSERVGLIEYESINRDIYEVLWYYTNPYATFFQERGWKTSNKTVFSYLSNEAYVDCLEDDFKHFIDMTLGGSMRVITPSMLPNIPTHYYECSDCGKRTLSATDSCKSLKKIDFSVSSSILFLDDSYVIYTPPDDSKIWKFIQRPQQLGDDGQSKAQEQEQELGQVLQNQGLEPQHLEQCQSGQSESQSREQQ